MIDYLLTLIILGPNEEIKGLHVWKSGAANPPLLATKITKRVRQRRGRWRRRVSATTNEHAAKAINPFESGTFQIISGDSANGQFIVECP